MIALTLAEVAEAVGGTPGRRARPGRPWSAGSVEFDSRAVTPGGCSSRCPASASTGTTSPRPRWNAVPWRVLGDPAGRRSRRRGRRPASPRSRRWPPRSCDRLPDLTVIGVTGLVRQDHHQGPVAALLRAPRADGRPAGVVQQRTRATPTPCCAPTPDTRFLVLENSARGIGHIAALCRGGAAADRCRAQRRDRAPRRVRLARGDRAGEGRTGRGAARRERGRGPERRRPAGAAMRDRVPAARVVTVGDVGDADVRADDVRLDAAGQAPFCAGQRGGQAPVALALVGAHQVAQRLAAAAVAAERGLRWPRSPARCRSRRRRAVGGWR